MGASFSNQITAIHSTALHSTWHTACHCNAHLHMFCAGRVGLPLLGFASTEDRVEEQGQRVYLNMLKQVTAELQVLFPLRSIPACMVTPGPPLPAVA